MAEDTSHFRQSFSTLLDHYGLSVPRWELPDKYDRVGRAMLWHERQQVLLRTYYLLVTEPQRIWPLERLEMLGEQMRETVGPCPASGQICRHPWEEVVEELRAEGRETLPLFGFGSLINYRSALFDISVRGYPAISFGFRRLFNFKDFNIDRSVIGAPVAEYHWEQAKLNCLPTGDFCDVMNGIQYEVALDDLPGLRQREEGYDLMKAYIIDEIEARDPNCDHPKVHETYLLVASEGSRTGTDIFPHVNYLHVCVEGANHYGRQFVDLFARTTYLSDGKTLLQNWVFEALKDAIMKG